MDNKRVEDELLPKIQLEVIRWNKAGTIIFNLIKTKGTARIKYDELVFCLLRNNIGLVNYLQGLGEEANEVKELVLKSYAELGVNSLDEVIKVLEKEENRLLLSLDYQRGKNENC